MDLEKIKRPRVPNRAVEYLTKDEVDRLMAAIPPHTWSGLRDRALIEVLFSTGMRISEALSLDRSAIDWERGEAVIIGKGQKQRKVYFRRETIDHLQRYLEKRPDDFPAVFIRNGQTIQRLQAHGLKGTLTQDRRCEQ